MQIKALTDETKQLKEMRGAAYTQDCSQHPQFRVLNEKYDVAQYEIKDLTNRLNLYTDNVKKLQDELQRKEEELQLKSDGLQQIEDDVKIMQNHIQELDHNNALYQ